jgi:rhodanese-related sulfurtransferase
VRLPPRRTVEENAVSSSHPSASPAVFADVPVPGPAVGPVEGNRLVDEGAVLLDVREPDEWVVGRDPRAVLVPLGQLAERTSELPADRPIVVICRSGRRSDYAAGHLRRTGRDAVNLAGGMQAWQAAGLPCETTEGGPGRVA